MIFPLPDKLSNNVRFGAGFNMMKEGDVHKLWPGLHLHMRFVICFCILLCSSSYHSMSSFRGVSILSHLSWVPDFRDRLPWFAMPLWPIARRWSAARLQQPAKAKDIWYHLVSQLINKTTAGYYCWHLPFRWMKQEWKKWSRASLRWEQTQSLLSLLERIQPLVLWLHCCGSSFPIRSVMSAS